ncbi:MAG TPA: alpha/beta hydrolase [Actinomycetes bacterium]|nr:alpha/beta hydrolase [Actinomycetes bacterium]
MSRAGRWRRGAGVLGAVAGAAGTVAVGAALGALAERRWASSRADRVETSPEAYGSLRGRVHPVTADDGTALHVEVDGPDDAPYTVVFCHGYALRADSWHFQRRDLTDLGRRVFWDQRGHGRSARGPAEHATIHQLGHDLAAVIAATAPTGPLVLVGHSMGAMTIMALARHHPELFADRVSGVALIATAAGPVPGVSLGVGHLAGRLVHQLAPGLLSALTRAPRPIGGVWRVGSDFAHAVTAHWAFGSPVPASLVRFATEMITSTPLEVIADFYPAFDVLDEMDSLEVLNQGVETLVLVGDHDQLTPLEHSSAIVAAVHGAELVVVPHAGHLVMLEHPAVVTAHLRGLVHRATRALPRSA